MTLYCPNCGKPKRADIDCKFCGECGFDFDYERAIKTGLVEKKNDPVEMYKELTRLGYDVDLDDLNAVLEDMRNE